MFLFFINQISLLPFSVYPLEYYFIERDIYLSFIFLFVPLKETKKMFIFSYQTK